MTTDTIVRVDPGTLLIGTNVRKDTQLSDEFKASIKENGVRVPITAYENGLGELVVVDGQRRALAAVDQGLPEVPVYVTREQLDVDRIIDQVVVNEQRSELFENEAVAAVQELALFEMKAPAIAKKLGLKKSLVDDALRIRLSDAAKDVYAKHGQLDIAVSVASLEGEPEQAELVGLKDAWQVREKARSLNMARERRGVEEKITAAGVTVVKEPGYYDEDPQPIRYLYTDAECKDGLDGMPHERIVELAGDGLVAWADKWGSDWRIEYGVKGWAARGLHVQAYRLSNARQGKPSTPEEAEALKVQRRIAREQTKVWVEATALRIQWLQQLVQRRTMPKGWEPIVARRLIDNSGYSTSQLRGACVVLSIVEDPKQYSIRENLVKRLEAAPTSTAQTMLGIAVGSIEGSTDFDKKGWSDPKAKDYLALLATWGYPLGELEQSIVDAGR